LFIKILPCEKRGGSVKDFSQKGLQALA